MKDRDRPCLKILASTGMRLDEVALLTFDDLKVDEDTGIRFFDLTDDVKLLKNDAASRRQVPVPDQLVLPSGQGRLFDYPKDIDGKSQNAASEALMRISLKFEHLKIKTLSCIVCATLTKICCGMLVFQKTCKTFC